MRAAAREPGLCWPRQALWEGPPHRPPERRAFSGESPPDRDPDPTL